MTMLNDALTTCWTTLDIEDANPRIQHPFMQFDPQSNRFILNAPYDFFERLQPGTIVIGGGSIYVELYFNTRLYELLSSFPAIFCGFAGDKNYLMVVKNNKLTNTISIFNPRGGIDYRCIQVYQDISTISMWNPIASIVFCTSLIPIIPTNTSPAMQFGDQSTNLISSGNNSNLSSILTDFEVAITETNQYRPTVTFSIGTEYRLIDMHAMMNLNKIDLMVYWKTHYGEMIPFRLQPGCAAHIKLLFRHKKFNGDQESEFP